MRSHNHVTKGRAAKNRRRKVALERAFASYQTYNKNNYIRCADPKEFVPHGMTFEQVLG